MKNFITKYLEQNFPSGSFRKNVATLLIGTVSGQLVLLITAPLISRLYSPSEFGIYALFISLVSLGTVVAAARYEQAILLPTDDNDSLSLLFLVTLVSGIFSLLLFIGLLLFKSTSLSTFYYLVPLDIFVTTVYQSFYFFILRKKMYQRLSSNNLIKSLFTVIFQIAFALLGVKSLGLIYSQILGLVVAILIFWLDFIEVSKNIKASLSSALGVAKRYVNFPKYALVSDIANTAANQLPNFVITAKFGSTPVGFLSLSQRILDTPTSFISTSLQDAFKERAASDYRLKGSCREIMMKLFRTLFFVSIVPFLLIFITSPVLVPFIFGPVWQPAGIYIRILTVFFFFRFVFSPFSYVLIIAEKQYILMLWQIFLFLLIAFGLYISVINKNVLFAIYNFSFWYSAMYLVLFYLSFIYSKKRS